ncbi:MAG: hypothetical protein JNK05_22770 [Myxococcales bacterium]|nr:hypothetical protein [Myxococcales bacterium]
MTPAVGAWTDARPAGLVTEVVVDRDGGATVTMRVRWRVVAGRFRAFELTELPSDATLVEATATDAQGAPVSVATRTPASGRLELELGEQSGLRRGTVDVVVRYTTSLRAQGAIRRSGDDAIVEFATVPWERGLEAAELRVATPTSIQRARWIADETPGVETTVSSEVGRDVVRAVRRHLPSGVRWTGRIACDRALFPWLEAPAAPTRAAVQQAQRDRWAQPAVILVLAAAFGALANKVRSTAPERPRLVPWPNSLRFFPVVLASLGGAAMGLSLDATQGALTAGSLVALLALVSSTPALEPLPRPSTDRAARCDDAQVRAIERESASGSSRAHLKSWVALTAAAILGWAGYFARSAAVALAGVASATALIAWILAKRDRRADGELSVLRAVERGLGIDNASGSARTLWRVRAKGAGVGVARLKLAPRPGFRAQKGLEAIEWAVRWAPSLLRWEPTPMLTVRAKRGSAMEKLLRIAATRAGRVVVATDGERLAWVVEWSGADRAVARESLASIVREGIAKRGRERADVAKGPRDERAIADELSAS